MKSYCHQCRWHHHHKNGVQEEFGKKKKKPWRTCLCLKLKGTKIYIQYITVCISAAELQKWNTFKFLKSISQRTCHCRPIGSLSSESLALTLFPKEIQRLKIKREQPNWKHQKLAWDVHGTKEGELCGQKLKIPFFKIRYISDMRFNFVKCSLRGQLKSH